MKKTLLVLMMATLLTQADDSANKKLLRYPGYSRSQKSIWMRLWEDQQIRKGAISGAGYVLMMHVLRAIVKK